MKNLAEAFQEELERNIDLLEQYLKIGLAGQFGAAMIRQKINSANTAQASGDVIQLMVAYENLKASE